ncbi:MAG TPA: hypothetical protein VFG14_09030 [Chthoniobacteraceae bacterium]|nr:hypothetical protein [Chthoniobacteraceae bacterium]
MARDASYDYDDEGLEPKRRDNLFIWTVFILLLVGVAFACWLGSFYIFGHPEEPRSYRILKKLKKIESPRRFDITAAPLGEFISPQKAFEKFSTMKNLELDRENAELLRIYIKNYTESKKLVPYLRGKFEVIETRELTSKDFFPVGTVALLQSQDYPQVVVEHLFPATGSNLESSKRVLTPGVPFPIEKTNDVTAVLHAERLADGRMMLTVVPLHYPSYALKGGAGTFATEPPTDLIVEAGLPVTKREPLNQSLARFAQLKSKSGSVLDDGRPAVEGPEIVRLDTVPLGQKAPETGAIPEPTVAAAQPVRPLGSTPRPITDLAMNSRSSAVPPIAPAVPLPTPPTVDQALRPATPPPAVAQRPTTTSPTGVPLKPFVQSNQGVVPQAEVGGNWRVYPAGQLPQGRSLTPGEAAGLADQPTADRVYLRGNFKVSAMGDNKAVLRPHQDPGVPESSMRIIAEFPSGSLLPAEGSVVSRDATRAFQVLRVSRATDGQINVEVRDVTR